MFSPWKHEKREIHKVGYFRKIAKIFSTTLTSLSQSAPRQQKYKIYLKYLGYITFLGSQAYQLSFRWLNCTTSRKCFQHTQLITPWIPTYLFGVDLKRVICLFVSLWLEFSNFCPKIMTFSMEKNDDLRGPESQRTRAIEKKNQKIWA